MISAAASPPPPFATRRSKGVTRDYVQATGDIEVRVAAFYLEDQSEPEIGRYVWAYRVTIQNNGRQTVQLVSRTWRITDGRGRIFLVEGEGVVGEKPVLGPGEAFEYTSGTPLETPSGFMTGAYHMITRAHDTAGQDGETFDVAIPTFSLDSPHQPGRVH
jgi:ApaG protein